MASSYLRVIRAAHRAWRSDEGATIVEYGIMVMLVAAACLAAVSAFGVATDRLFTFPWP